MRNNFMPQSRYYGDKYARTMEEAFGPGAELHTEPDDFDPFTCMVLGAVFAVAVVCVVIGTAWLLSRG